jgi:gas vesicle protein
MKNTHFSCTILAIVLLAVGASASCSHAPLTPSQTVQHYWAALISGNLDNAKQYSTEESAVAMGELQKEFAAASVSFGKVILESNKARIETTLSYSPGEQKKNASSTTFETVLNKQEQDWKVDYVATKKSLDDARRKKGLSKLVDDLEKLGRDVSGKLDGVIKNWEEVTPEIKEDLEELGNSMQKQLQESIDKHGPEIQKKLQDFTESIDDALKDLEKSLPQEKKEEKPQDPEARMI